MCKHSSTYENRLHTHYLHVCIPSTQPTDVNNCEFVFLLSEITKRFQKLFKRKCQWNKEDFTVNMVKNTMTILVN